MIFISYSHEDKETVYAIYEEISKEFGENDKIILLERINKTKEVFSSGN